MKKIFVIVFAVSAFFASCTSPYYPEYRPIIALGADTSNLICEYTEDYQTLRVISNVEYEATIVSGSEWLKFTDTDAVTRKGSGNGDIEFKHLQNNNAKRVAHLVLSAGSRRDTINIKQKGRFEEFLEVHPNDVPLFELEGGTRMPVAWEGGEYSFRLRTSCSDAQLSAWTADTKVISGFKFENSVCSFRVSANDEQQPRIVLFQISYVDGWDDKQTIELSIRQGYNPALVEE